MPQVEYGWHEIDYWKYNLKSDTVFSILIFLSVFLVTIVILWGIAASLAFWIGYSITLALLSLLWPLTSYVNYRASPRAVSLDGEAIHIKWRTRGREPPWIPFEDIEMLEIDQHPKGAIGVLTKDGKLVALHPGLSYTSRFTQALLEAYKDFLAKKGFELYIRQVSRIGIRFMVAIPGRVGSPPPDSAFHLILK